MPPGKADNVTERLAALEGRLADYDAAAEVSKLMNAYANGCDTHKDADRIADLFAVDGVWEGIDKASDFGKLVGRDAIRSMFAENPARQPFTIHYLSNERITVEGDAALGEWYLWEPSTLRGGELPVWMAGYYRNDFAKIDGEWRIQHLRCGMTFITPYEAGWVKDPSLRVSDA